MHAHSLLVVPALAAAVLLTACAASRSSSTTASHGGAEARIGSSVATAEPAWDFNATIIEACSCPMFCQCYFNSRPAGPGCCSNPDDPLLEKRFCRFNNAFRVNRGTYDGAGLDGVKFWIAGDLGSDFSEGQLDWAILHYDPAVTAKQREAIPKILAALYPAKWTNFSVGKDARIDWEGGKDRSEARLDGGKMAEVVLARNQGMTDEPIVIHNLRYWGAPRNDGFVLMQNDIETYRAGEKPYEFKRTNGFMITVDISSADAAAATKSGY